MMAAPLAHDESVRLLDLARYEVLDSAREEVFDRITRLAARLLGVPMAAINLLDADRIWNKSAIGLDFSEMPRHQSFCTWTIQQDEPLVVPDLSSDSRFARNPLVLDEPGLRMYAGAALSTPSGSRIGTLCVMDTVAHTPTPEDLQSLQDLAATAMNELELRLQLRRTARDLQAQEERASELQRSLGHAQTLEAVSTLMDLPIEPEEVALQAAALIGQAIHADWSGIVCYQDGVPYTRRAYAHVALSPVLLDLATHLNAAEHSVTHTLGGLTEPLYLDRYPAHPDALPAMVAAGLRSVSYVPLGRWEDQVFHLVLFRAGESRRQPWRESDRSLLEAAARSVRAALHRRAALKASEDLARTDALTGVPGRRAFDEDLATWADRPASFRLAMVDLDGFKGINDQEGHAQGDKVLRVFAGVLDSELPPGSVYRLGGDEFAVLLADEVAAAEVEDAIDLAVLAARQISLGRIGASFGLAHQSEAGRTDDVVTLADTRMYEAKRRRQERRTQLSAS